MRYEKWLSACFVIVSVFLLIQCKKDKPSKEDSRLPYIKALDPKTQISELCKNLIIKGVNKNGRVPLSNSNALQIVIAQQSASITNDNILFVPFVFRASNPVSGIYMQINGADNYWDISAPPTNDDVYVIDVGIPARVSNGSFDLLYQLHDEAGNVGNQGKMNVSVVSAQSFCDNQNPIPRVEGQDGLTVRTFDMGDKPGKVHIGYNTYTVKDRIDIRYNNKWVNSTGALLNNSSTPPIKQCNRVGSGDGFVGATGTFEIDYDPAISRKLDVYVSGCLDGGTQWYFDVSCPVSTAKPWYDDLPACPCTYVEAQRLANTARSGWLDCGSANQDYHYGATSEVRWSPPQNGMSGQQCTYDNIGNLITSGIAAGSPDIVSPRGCGVSLVTMQNYPDHKEKDIVPWETKPCLEYLKNWPANNKSCLTANSRPNPKNDIVHHTYMRELVGDMTCEQITDLFKEADKSSAAEIPKNLKAFLFGINPNAYPNKNTLIADLKLWRSNRCLTVNVFGVCALIDKAVKNLGG